LFAVTQIALQAQSLGKGVTWRLRLAGTLRIGKGHCCNIIEALMATDFEGKVALITGGARGVGFDIAERLLQEGTSVFICGRDASRLEAALDRLRGLNGKSSVDGAVADVRNYADCRRAIQFAAGRTGRVDILVNNAGIGIFKPVDQLTPEEWDATIQTNLSGAFYCCREAIPIMRRQGGGHIFHISSLLAIHPIPAGAAYNASKFGLNGFSEAMMEDVRHDGIRVTIIMPGSIATDFGGSPGSNQHEPWKLKGADIARAVVDAYRQPSHALVSRIEIRSSQPPRKK
jgi:3-oxoacyl-[acyl-carrier protein] reductase